MAEFCLDCWNEINETNYPAKNYIISDYLDLCEGCAEWKPIVIMERKYYYLYRFHYVFFPFKIIWRTLYILWRILLLPYLFYKYRDYLKEQFRKN